MTNQMVTKNTRIESFDIVRGIGIILMVMGHEGFGAGFDKMIHTFHMPLFFFVSGYFYRPEKIKSIHEYIAHLAKTLLVPYLCFAVFYEILHFIFAGEMTMEYFLKSLFSSNHNRIDVAGALWFLLCLFSAKVVYHVLAHVISNQRWLTITVLILGLIANNLRHFDIYMPLCLDSAISCLPLIHAGYYLYKYRDTKACKTIINFTPWFIFACVLIWITTSVLNDHVIIRRNKYGFIPLYWISCFTGIFMCLNFSSLIEHATCSVVKKVKTFLMFCGRESLVFLVLNELFLYVVGEMFKRAGVAISIIESNYLVRFLIVCGTLAALYACAIIAKRKPISYIFGKW